MPVLWTYGALQKRKILLSAGLPRGIELEDAAHPNVETVIGARNSALLPSPDGKRILIFEWDDFTNNKYVIDL